MLLLRNVVIVAHLDVAAPILRGLADVLGLVRCVSIFVATGRFSIFIAVSCKIQEVVYVYLKNLGAVKGLTLIIGQIETDGRRRFPCGDLFLCQFVLVLKIGELPVLVPRLVQLQPQRVDEARRQGREGDGGREQPHLLGPKDREMSKFRLK